ncbi:MAG: N-(5'-phosphoribosyl)anthranilate isomerase, partial [Gemmatimonadota bacterium]
PVLHDGEDLEQALEKVPDGMPVLLEAAGRGGRGIRPDWERAFRLARLRPLVLAGGLSPDNVGGAIRTVRPWGVDVSSGVESSPGVKSAELIGEFVRAVRLCEAEVTR